MKSRRFLAHSPRCTSMNYANHRQASSRSFHTTISVCSLIFWAKCGQKSFWATPTWQKSYLFPLLCAHINIQFAKYLAFDQSSSQNQQTGAQLKSKLKNYKHIESNMLFLLCKWSLPVFRLIQKKLNKPFAEQFAVILWVHQIWMKPGAVYLLASEEANWIREIQPYFWRTFELV